MQLCDRLLLQRRHVAPGHDGVLQAGVLCEALRHHGLPRAGRPVEHGVLQRHPSPLCRRRGICKPHDLLAELRMEHHIIELRAAGRAEPKQSQQANENLLEGTPLVGHAHQRRPPQALVQLLSQQDGHLPHKVHTAQANHDGANQQRQVCGRAEDRLHPLGCHVGRGLNGREHLSAPFRLLRLHHAGVDILILARGLDLTFLLDPRLLYSLRDSHLRTALVRLEPKLQELLLIFVLLLLLSEIGLLLLAEQL
mmetsp:Transcript_47056/g.111762  ORF Transcript_47056/g.111762 Transcript_47056/m.111762 type:complete len:252 (+) Transcript_47056:792-1547(+)